MSDDVATPDYLSPAAVAAKLDTTTHALAQMRYRGGGPPYVVMHSRVRYPRVELEEYLAALPRRRSTSERATLLGL